MEPKLRLEASLESLVESKLALKSGWTGLRGPRTAAGSLVGSNLAGVGALQALEPLELRDILAEHYVGLLIIKYYMMNL